MIKKAVIEEKPFNGLQGRFQIKKTIFTVQSVFYLSDRFGERWIAAPYVEGDSGR